MVTSLKKPTLPISSRRVLVIAGGWSAERDISVQSGQNVAHALKNLGHCVEVFDPPRALEAFATGINRSFGNQGPEIIFNILHGHDGEDGVVQGLLHLTGIPYTFSGVLGSALAMHKGISRQIAIAQGVQCPEGEVLSQATYLSKPWHFFPHVCKPLGEGSTFGVTYVENPEMQKRAFSHWSYGKDVLVERYIPGREIQVAVFNGQAMGAVEIRFQDKIFSYDAKYTEGKAQHLIPAPLHPQAYQQVLQMAETMHRALYCRGVTRSDFRYDDRKGEAGEFFYIETNSQPGMTAISLVPDIARNQGWTYEEVVQWILEDAICPL